VQNLNTDPFGGDWSGTKLDALARYLHAYTTALKKQPFDLLYIDAFAGAGIREVIEVDDDDLFSDDNEKEVTRYRHGSPFIALETDPKFDRFVFIDKDQSSIDRLREQVKQSTAAQGRPIDFRCGDANAHLRNLAERSWSGRRAVAFLDPFALHVEWDTIEAIAKTQSIDMWLLFPAMAVNRMLPRNGVMPEQWVRKLNATFGTTEWREFFYRKDDDLFGEEIVSKTPRIFSDLSDYVTMRLEKVFEAANKKPLILRNSTDSPLFLLCFASGNPKGAKIAVGIAQQIIDKKSNGN
jgi:three-Cys-motif partner protein